MKQHTESSIIKELRSYFQNGYTYRIDNAFIFSYDWESDFFCTNREGWAFEIIEMQKDLGLLKKQE